MPFSRGFCRETRGLLEGAFMETLGAFSGHLAVSHLGGVMQRHKGLSGPQGAWLRRRL